MRLAACAFVAMMAPLCVSIEARAQSVDSQYTIDSGCLHRGATGWYRVSSGGTFQEVLIVDTDGDGLPEEAYCPGDKTATSLTSTGTVKCGGLDTISSASTNCAFSIDVWRGSSGADQDTSGKTATHISCASNSRPVMMFGGEGIDWLEGSPYGDFIHGGYGVDWLKGGNGHDMICLSQGAANETQPADGGPGDDILWGGLHVDALSGYGGDDLLGSGASADFSSGGAGADSIHMGAGDDECDGEDGQDVLHLGMGDDEGYGGDHVDIILAQDFFADSTVDGEGGADICWLDDASSTARDDTGTSCSTTNAMVPCDPSLFVATNDGTHAYLYELQNDGVRLERARLNSSTGVHPELVVGLAVDPTDCLLYLVVEETGTQKLVTVDTSTEPGKDEYDYTTVGTVSTSDALVDIAFGARGFLIGLESDADLVTLDTTTAADTHVGTTGRAGADALHLAFDDPDSGSLFVYTERNGAVDVDVFDPETKRTRNLEHDIDWLEDGPLPFTVMPVFTSGRMLEIEPTYDGTNGGYPMWMRDRPNWQGGLSGTLPKATATDGRVEWAFCSGGSQCFADLQSGEPPDAITAPHWNE